MIAKRFFSLNSLIFMCDFLTKYVSHTVGLCLSGVHIKEYPTSWRGYPAKGANWWQRIVKGQLILVCTPLNPQLNCPSMVWATTRWRHIITDIGLLVTVYNFIQMWIYTCVYGLSPWELSLTHTNEQKYTFYLLITYGTHLTLNLHSPIIYIKVVRYSFLRRWKRST